MTHRRGANAVEFALVAPILVFLLGGIVDYGWFFWREALAVNAVHEGLRAGSMKSPNADTEGEGQCGACITQAETAAYAALNDYGFHGVTIDVTLERMPATGTPCTYALVTNPTIPHQRIMPLVPGADRFTVRVRSMAQGVPCE